MIQMVCPCRLYIFVSTTTYQIVFIVSELQYNVKCRSNILLFHISTCIFLFLAIIPTVLDLHLYIFVLDYNPPDKI
jgi:hypothetical protein